jgi:hypothetical protein
MAVDEVGFDSMNHPGKPPGSSKGKTAGFIEDVYVVGLGQAADKASGIFQAADVDFKLFPGKAGGHIDQAILHSARIERKDDMKDSAAGHS